MASIHVAIVSVDDRALTGSTLQISPGKVLRAKTLTSTSTSVVDPDLIIAENEVGIFTADADCWVHLADDTDHEAGPSSTYSPSGGSHKLPSGMPIPLGGDADLRVAHRTVA